MAPAGVDPEINSKAVQANAAKPGNSFRDKQITGWRMLGQGKLKEGDSGLESTFVVVQSAKQLQRATITLSVESLMSAKVSAAHAEYMHLNEDGMRDHLLAVVTRNFGGKHFELSKFVTSMAGAPAKAFLANGFGEAEKCVMNAAMGDSAGSAEDDRRLYP